MIYALLATVHVRHYPFDGPTTCRVSRLDTASYGEARARLMYARHHTRATYLARAGQPLPRVKLIRPLGIRVRRG